MWGVYFKSFPNFVQVVPHGLALLVQVPGGGAQGLVAAGHRLVPGGLLLQLRLNRITYILMGASSNQLEMLEAAKAA